MLQGRPQGGHIPGLRDMTTAVIIKTFYDSHARAATDDGEPSSSAYFGRRTASATGASSRHSRIQELIGDGSVRIITSLKRDGRRRSRLRRSGLSRQWGRVLDADLLS